MCGESPKKGEDVEVHAEVECGMRENGGNERLIAFAQPCKEKGAREHENDPDGARNGEEFESRSRSDESMMAKVDDAESEAFGDGRSDGRKALFEGLLENAAKIDFLAEWAKDKSRNGEEQMKLDNVKVWRMWRLSVEIGYCNKPVVDCGTEKEISHGEANRCGE